jgi:N-methylhydantoinase A/oxoprolinase/acetone carboxylase beta subunit
MAQDDAAGLAGSVSHLADVCYVGQSHHLEVPVDLSRPDPRPALRDAFMEAHRHHYGQAVDRPMHLVNLRSVHQAHAAAPPGIARHVTEATPRAPTRRMIVVEGAGTLEAVALDRASLAEGDVVAGPAIIEQPDTTTLIEPGWAGRVVAGGLIVIERAA